MRIGILGSGLMGGKLGTIFARAGHEVVFSYARSEQKLKRPTTPGMPLPTMCLSAIRIPRTASNGGQITFFRPDQ